IQSNGCGLRPVSGMSGRLIEYLYEHSLGNPKAILIFTAFLPQFVTVGSATPVSEQFLWLGALFLLLEWAAIALYAGLGAYMQRWFSQPGPRRVFNRVSASLLGCAGLGLLAARR
ncbi:TPA: LysE family translocator, partial [Pseudomonas putida]